MAEAIAISLSTKLAVALSRGAAVGLAHLLGIGSEISAAERDLDLLRALLRFADSCHGTDALAAAWVKQVRDAAFELEDVADEWCYLSGHGRARDWVHVRAWFALSKRLRKAREKLSRLAAAKEQFGIRAAPADGPGPPAVSMTRQILAESSHFVEKDEVVGFSAHETQLLDCVVQDSEPRRTLVAVLGMGGVGKTTLVTRVFKQVAARHFDCAAWVAVSQGFTMDDLLNKILKELRRDAGARGAHGPSGSRDGDTDYRSLVTAVRGHLGNKRYVVVLDDVWDSHLWDKLRHAFPDDETGSRVVVTTRSGDVAKAAATERIMALEPLPWDEAWTLFCNVAFREVPGRTCPEHLTELAANMLERCCGLPLAIVSVGNLLALKDRTEFAWRNVRDSLVWDRSSCDLGIGEAASILSLSIDDLPHHLKKCFLSCSVYPEDLWIKRKILIRKWVAQGFVQDKPGQCTAEDVGDHYLDQLVQRSLMQPVARNEFGRAKRCLIHDLIRELIIHRSKEEEGFFEFAKCNKITMADHEVRIRHLALDRCEDVDSWNVRQIAMIRTFNVFGSALDASFLSRFRLLTLLNLWFVKMNKLPSSVTNLHNLRYLGVRATLIEELPKDLGKLQNLQILDAKLSMVRRLPSSIAKLKNLRHLIVLTRATSDFLKPYPGTAVGVPQGLQNLDSLQTLKYVEADKKMVRSLAKLEQMRSLELSGIDASLAADLSSSISRMSFLLRLGLAIKPGADAVLDLESIFRPPLKLQKLALTGRLARGKLPPWISSLTSLVQLRLCGCQIAQDSLVLLAALPRLVNFSLIGGAYHDKDMIFTGGSFPTLRKLTLEGLPNLCHIAFQQGCLLNLRDLVLGQCTDLTETPLGMENLKHVKNMELFGMPSEFVGKLKEQNTDAEYHNPASSDFYQAPRFLRLTKFVERDQ